MVAQDPAAFISYCREDSEFALRLAQDLKAAGASVWIDQIDIPPGAHWDNAIEDALMASPRMLLVLSPSSSRSHNVRNEISFALEQGKIVIPVLYKDCIVPLQLQRNNRIDFRADYARGLQMLLANLQITEPDREVLDQVAEDDAKRRAAWEAREAEAQLLRELEQQRQAEHLAQEKAQLERLGLEQKAAETERLAREPRAQEVKGAAEEPERPAQEMMAHHEAGNSQHSTRKQETRAAGEAAARAERANQRLCPIAPLWHTGCVIVFLVLRTWLTTRRVINLEMPAAESFLLFAAFDCVFVAFLFLRTSAAFTAYLARTLHRPRSLAWDIPVGILLAAAIILITYPVARLLVGTAWQIRNFTVPPAAVYAAGLLWAIVHGVFTETVFRGYLQRQIAGWTRSVTIGVLVQAIVYGFLYSYSSNWRYFVIGCLWGLIYGVFAVLRKGLRANILADVILNIMGVFSV